jgi:hypothetical protein
MMTPAQFFARLRWIDGRPLLTTLEPYRLAIFDRVFVETRPDGSPRYNQALAGRAKKNWKSADLDLAAIYVVTCRPSPQGSDVLIVANDEDQAANDLDLAKKIVERNPVLGEELEILGKEIRRRDGKGSIKIIPAGDAKGAHGKTFAMVGFDEIHAYRNWDLLEALQPDPTRPDALTWITSYDSFYNSPGNPLFDLKKMGMAGTDPRMLFSWYSADHCTDPDFKDLPPEQRANPSMASWPEGIEYLNQQRRRLPTHKFRRLHLNLEGAPAGAFFDPDAIREAMGSYKARSALSGVLYFAFVDMSGGSSDDAVLAIAHVENGKIIVDRVEHQLGKAPFNPRDAVKRFVGMLRDYGIRRVTGDRYAGETFRADFRGYGIEYIVSTLTKSELYEAAEPRINAGEVEFPNLPTLEHQLLGLVLRGSRVDHVNGEHDDAANAACGAIFVASGGGRRGEVSVSIVSPGGVVTPMPTGGRIDALSADRGGCEPSRAWLEKNNDSEYGSKFIGGMF